MGYFKHSLIGISWMSAFRVSSRIVAFVKVIILARLLTPAQFGVFGIASLVLSLLEVITETGVNVILIQKKEGIVRYIDDAWVVSIVRGFAIGAFILLLSPLIVTFFKNTDAYPIIFLTSVVPIIRGFINPAIVTYQKELQFNKEFSLRFTIFFCDALVSIIVTLLTKDATGIVWGLIAGAFLEVILSFLIISPRPYFKIHKEYVKELFTKGKWVTAYVLFNYVGQEGDSFVVGRLLGSASLGIYQMGFKLSTLPISEISDVVNKVVFPVFVKISHDRKRLKKAFSKTMFVVCILSLTLSLTLILLPKSIFTLILGDKWIQVTTVIQILALYGTIRAITSIPSSLFLALHKQNYIAGMTFARLIALTITIIPFTVLWGIVGASISSLFAALVELPLVVYYVFIVFRKTT